MVKQEFIKQWITTLHMLDSFVGHPTNLNDRKDRIRLSSEIAIAAARSIATIWSRALISRTRKKTTNKPVARRVLKKARNRVKNRRAAIGRNASLTTNARVRKRMDLLRRLVPGGELIGEKDCLIRETLDYIVFLQAQVDFMRTVAAIHSDSGDLPNDDK